MKTTMTTLFWVGEPDNDDNDYITNVCSYWDKDWQKNYGGVDDPKHRKGYFPAGFTPRKNPFYATTRSAWLPSFFQPLWAVQDWRLGRTSSGMRPGSPALAVADAEAIAYEGPCSHLSPAHTVGTS